MIETTVADGAFGACYAKLNVSTTLPGCTNSQFVTFDCENSFGDTNKSVANLKFQQAQLAKIVAGTRVAVLWDNTKISDGICFGSRIIVLE